MQNWHLFKKTGICLIFWDFPIGMIFKKSSRHNVYVYIYMYVYIFIFLQNLENEQLKNWEINIKVM
jgi:hypothetical protein